MPKTTSVINPDDHAVVVGIAHYPGLLNEEGKPSNLDGPVTDATSIRDWLVAADGGGLAAKNIAFITSTRRVKRARSAKPTLATIQQAFRDLQAKTRSRPGRRLYVYMSGHGFAPDEDKGSLFTAECEVDVDLPNVWVTEYLKWFRAKQRFEEFVLWMDCCCDQDLTITPLPITFPRAVLSGKAGPRLLGIAAQTGMKAAEAPMPQDNGRVHGVFTWTLLNGLRNAVNAKQLVTGESLRDYLLNSMQDFLPQEAKDGSEISLQPYVFADQGIVFGPKRTQKTARAGIRLTFPKRAVGEEVRIWTGSPPRIVAKGRIERDGFTANLDTGIYVAEVAASRLRQGFEVTKSNASSDSNHTLNITEKGEPIARRIPRSCIIEVGTGTKAAAIHLIDSSFGQIAEYAGFFSAGHKPGVFKLRIQYGREVVDVSEKILVLDRDTRLTIEPPALKSAVPIEGTAYTHEFHVAAADLLATRPQAKAAQLGIMGRFWTGQRPTVTDASRYPHPLQGLSLLAADGTVVADVSAFEATQLTSAHGGGDPVTTLALDVDPGIYFLRQQLASGRVVERTLVASKDWRMNMFIRRDFKDIAEEGATSARISRTGSVAVLMLRRGTPPTPQQRQDQLTIEAARLALKQRCRILEGDLEILLCRKFDNPIMGIIGAHLLIMETMDPEAPWRAERIRWLDEIVRNLRKLLGEEHPDVEAISLLCPNKTLRATRAVQAPPMFVRSWEILLNHGKKILPNEIAKRAKARTAGATYLNWAIDQRSKVAFTRSLQRQIKTVASIGKLRTGDDLRRKYPQIAAFAQHSLEPSRVKFLLKPTSNPKAATRASQPRAAKPAVRARR